MNYHSISELKRNLSGVLPRLKLSGGVRVTRRGRAVAVLLSIADYDRLSSARPEPDWEVLKLDTRGFNFGRDKANAC